MRIEIVFRIDTTVFAAIFLVALQSVVRAELAPVLFPTENSHSEEKRVLGKILFWDEQISSDDTMACGTCHIPSFGGADPRLGVHPGFDSIFGTDDDIVGSPGIVHLDANKDPVNDSIFGFSPQVTGRAAQSYFASMFAMDTFWDGRATSRFIDPEDGTTELIAQFGGLESQAVGPILSSVEMAHEGRTWQNVKDKLNGAKPLLLASDIPADMQQAIDASPTYAELFTQAFGDSAISAGRIAFAIATYERTLLPDQSPWDLYEGGNNTAMTPAQINGWEILRDNTVCLNCHQPPTFSDDRFHNIGLRPSFEDEGRFAVTGNSNDHGRFKTPSLRNVGLKPTLMHVGWITDVQDSIDFYNAGTQSTIHTQFTADQSGIPTNTPNFFADYNTIDMNPLMQPNIIDFIVNGLTDPRVANELFPFDRPTLLSELPQTSVIYANGSYEGLENGSQPAPYNTLEEALVHVTPSGTVILSSGAIGSAITISQPVTLDCDSGTVTIGTE
ncbi:MAG: cytochrome c peroxidase [Candidatus Hydrogenedentota bacterium]